MVTYGHLQYKNGHYSGSNAPSAGVHQYFIQNLPQVNYEQILLMAQEEPVFFSPSSLIPSSDNLRC